MVLAVKVSKKHAEKVKTLLIKKKVYNSDYLPESDKDFVYFPVKQKITDKNVQIIQKKLRLLSKKQTLKQALKSKLSTPELKHLKTAYDVLGDMAIIEIDKPLEKKEKVIGQTLLQINKSIKKVAKKIGIHKGLYRLQKLKIIAGQKKKEVVYKENNIVLKFNPEKVYFSPRLSTERKRVYKLVKPGETVLVMFSGCAPYPAVISKNTKANKIVGIEINPSAHKYGLENLRINKLNNIELYLGDVKNIVPKLNTKFDRILMPLPKSAEDFLQTALSVAKKGSIIHFYDFLEDTEFSKAEEKVKKACSKAKLKYKPIILVKCGQHAPHVSRVCFDFKIL